MKLKQRQFDQLILSQFTTIQLAAMCLWPYGRQINTVPQPQTKKITFDTRTTFANMKTSTTNYKHKHLCTLTKYISFGIDCEAGSCKHSPQPYLHTRSVVPRWGKISRPSKYQRCHLLGDPVPLVLTHSLLWPKGPLLTAGDALELPHTRQQSASFLFVTMNKLCGKLSMTSQYW